VILQVNNIHFTHEHWRVTSASLIQPAARITNTKAYAMSSWTLPLRTGLVQPMSHSLSRFLSRRLRVVALMRAAHRQRRALARLEAAALADIGITPAEARTEAARPVWDLPETPYP